MLPTTRVAFIGAGRIGAPMALRIASCGFPVRVFDTDWQCLDAELGRSSLWAADLNQRLYRADSAAQAATGADVVCLCLPGPKDVESVLLGDPSSSPGLLDGLCSTVLVDHTTSVPKLSQRIHSACADSGRQIASIDAPVSGGVESARTGDLTMLVGAGDPAVVERARPVLEAMASHIGVCGGAGAGMSCKLLHNAAVFASDMVLAEAMTTAVKAGIDTDAFHSVLCKSAIGKAFQLHVRLPETWLHGEFEQPRFQLRTAYKDVSLAVQLAEEAGVPTHMLSHCQAEMAMALARPGWGVQDMSVMHRLQEERAGTEVRLREGRLK